MTKSTRIGTCRVRGNSTRIVGSYRGSGFYQAERGDVNLKVCVLAAVGPRHYHTGNEKYQALREFAHSTCSSAGCSISLLQDFAKEQDVLGYFLVLHDRFWVYGRSGMARGGSLCKRRLVCSRTRRWRCSGRADAAPGWHVEQWNRDRSPSTCPTVLRGLRQGDGRRQGVAPKAFCTTIPL